MSKILWKSLLLSPAILGATIAASSSAIAVTTPKGAEALQPKATTEDSQSNKLLASLQRTQSQNSDLSRVLGTTPVSKPATLVAQTTVTPAQTAASPTTQASPSVNSLDAIDRYSNEGKGNNPNNTVAQVTSVSQLSDVQPTDWAFQALQSLVERYGVIAGYPDGSFRGNRAMTRYEFAAGLNAALDRVNELIAAGTADAVRKEDLATLQRLQEEFTAELATLRGRVDTLEAVTAELEANQFSTTTKLVGEVIASVTDAFGNDVNGRGNNTVFQDRVRLDFQTSFRGNDILHTRLSAGNGRAFDLPGSQANGAESTRLENQSTGTFEGTQTFQVQPDENFGNDVRIDWAAYDFAFLGESRAYIAAAGGIHSDYAPTVNPYFEDYDGGRGALSTFASENPIYRIGGGSGIGLNLSLGKSGILRATSLTLGYLADNANNPDDSFGLFNGDYAALGQLNITLSDRFSVAATYVHGYHNPGDGIFDLGGSFNSSNQSTGPIVGTTLANNPSSLLNNGLGEAVPIVTNSYGVEAAFRLSDRISISGFGTYTNATLIGRGNGEIWTYGAGVALPDFGKEGNLLGIFAGVQPNLRGIDAAGATNNFSRDIGYHIEGFYRYQLTDNISITPGVIWLTAPGQEDDNDDAVVGTLRTTFNF